MKEKNKKAVYTAIFGQKDILLQPEVIVPDFDYICFTDTPFESSVWKVRVVAPPVAGNPRRSARKIKILPHEYLPEYETSIWVDGNLRIIGDPNALLSEMKDASIAMFDHAATTPDSISSVYEEAEHILKRFSRGVILDEPSVIRKQVDTYRKEGLPGTGVTHYTTMVVVRKHMDPKIIEAMDSWWSELQKFSVRDQLSWPYVKWKLNPTMHTLPGDSRNNAFVKHSEHVIPPTRTHSPRQFFYRVHFFSKKLISRIFSRS